MADKINETFDTIDSVLLNMQSNEYLATLAAKAAAGGKFSRGLRQAVHTSVGAYNEFETAHAEGVRILTGAPKA